MPSSSRVVTSEEPRSSKNYEVLNSDDTISAGLQPTRLLQLIIFLHGFQSRSSEKSLASQVFCDSLSECNIQVILARCVSL